MHRVRTSPILLLLSLSLLLLLLPAGSAIADGPDPVPASEAINEPAATERPLYGPILSKDPATRALIKHLYLEGRSLEAETLARIEELNLAYAAEVDADFRWELSNEMGELKRTLEIRSIEIGLEIARLNGQEGRAAEFALALDQILHPENYLPAHRPDPALKAARLRDHGE